MKNILSVIAIVAILAAVAGLLFAYVGFFSAIGAVVLLLIGFAYALDSGALTWLFPNNEVADSGGQVIEGEFVEVDEEDDMGRLSNVISARTFNVYGNYWKIFD